MKDFKHIQPGTYQTKILRDEFWGQARVLLLAILLCTVGMVFLNHFFTFLVGR